MYACFHLVTNPCSRHFAVVVRFINTCISDICSHSHTCMHACYRPVVYPCSRHLSDVAQFPRGCGRLWGMHACMHVCKYVRVSMYMICLCKSTGMYMWTCILYMIYLYVIYFVCDLFVCDLFVCDLFVCDLFVCDLFVCDLFVCGFMILTCILAYLHTHTSIHMCAFVLCKICFAWCILERARTCTT